MEQTGFGINFQKIFLFLKRITSLQNAGGKLLLPIDNQAQF